jgi:drug/metabolite transporter (DMT)-like permease
MLLVAPSIGTGALSAVGTLALLLSSVSWALGSPFIKGEFASKYLSILCHGNDYWRNTAYHDKHTTRGIS